MLGITKAYTTRVGSGPFPTELNDEVGQHPRRARARVRRRHRAAAALRLVRRGGGAPSDRLGGIDGIALTKLDVLDGFDEVKFCTGYRRGGVTYDYLPAGITRAGGGRAGL